jgi:hypothetical protein
MKRPFSVLLLTLLLTPAVLPAQGPPAAPPPSPERTGWHTVRPGETLEGIAAQFLGAAERWTEIYRLNPDIRDPHWISPGRRIRIPSVESSLPAARLNRLSRQVEDQPSPIPWQNAQEGDMLVERDGVRTHQKSSAEMQFLDGARLTLTEDSLVFLHRTGSALRGTPKKSIEIVQGQADLDARTASAALPSPEVEIVLGSTKATSRPDGAGAARTRARKAEEGGAKLMAYGGQSEVEAGGAKVQVPHGMGTSVAAQGPPSPPEPLLPAPVLTAPEPNGQRACIDPPLSWQPVPGAASYIVEICRDPACGALIDRHLGETAAQWRPAALPQGDLYWRVTARSRSGLDGYPSEAIRLAITADHPGAKEIAAAGAIQAGEPQERVGDRLFVAPTTKVEIVAEDAGAKAAPWRPVIGGKTESAWPASWSPGEHTVAAVAEDGCGGRATIAPLTFVVDAEPPAIHWEVGDHATLADRLATDSEQDRRRLSGRRSGGHAPLEAWRSRAGIEQIPVPWDAEPGKEKALQPFEIRSEHPQAFFAAPDTALTADGKQGTLGENRILWMAAEDAGAGVDRMIVRTRVEGDHVVMEIEARDLVGNVSKKELVLRKR